MPIVNAYGKRINFPDDMSHEEIANVISANEKDLNPDYKAPDSGGVRSFIENNILGFSTKEKPSIADQAEATADEGANTAAPQIKGAPVRQSFYNKALLDNTIGNPVTERFRKPDREGVMARIRNAADEDIKGQIQQREIEGLRTDGVVPEGGFVALAKSGVGQSIKAAGQLGSDYFGADKDNALIKYGDEIIRENPGVIKTLQDIKDQPFMAFKEASGNMVPSFGAMLGTAVLGQGIISVAPLTGPLAPVIAAVGAGVKWLGPAAIAALPSYGSIRDKQIFNDKANEDSEKAKAIALLGASAVGAIEVAFGPQNWAISMMTKEGRAALARKFAATTPWDAFMKGGLLGGASEGAEELVQNPIEQLSSFENPLTKKNIEETKFGGAMGFIGGFAPGGITNTANYISQQAQIKADRINAERAKLGLDKIVKSTTVDEAINAANESVSQKPVDKDDVLRVADPTLADIERLTGLKPSESIQEAERQQSILSQAQQENNAIQSDIEGKNNRKQKTPRDTEIVLPDNKTLNAQWDIVDADNVKASLKNGESQPRDRTRAASDLQIQSIAKNPDYRRLSDSPVMDIGAPVLSNDGQIVGGNGRFEAISRAYDQDTAQEYIDNLRQDAIRKGIDPAVIDQMKKPVLVRRISQPFDTRQLAIASNSGMSAQYSDLEQARLDSERLKGLEDIITTDNGDIALTADNIRRVRDSLSNYSPAEIAPFVDANGQLSQQGIKRIRNAMLAKAYGDNTVIQGLIESNDSDIRNILGALTRVVGDAVKAQSNAPKESNITPSLLESVNIYRQLKQKNQPVSNYLKQQDAFSGNVSPAVENILMFLDKNARSQSKLTEFFRDAYTKLGSIDTKTADIFGEQVKPKPEDLFAKPTIESQLEKHLKKNGYEFDVNPVTEREFNSLDGSKKAQKELAEKQAKIFGKKVVFVKTKGKFGINGVMVPAIKDTIFIDLNTPKPFHAVMAHELSHWMEQENPKAYKDMLGALKNIIINEEGYRRKYNIDDQTEGLIPREIAGDLMGDNFTKPEFWQKVAEYNPSKFKEIAQNIIKWLKNIILKAKARGMGSEEWVTDAKKAQDIIAKAVSQYTKRQDAVGEKVEFKKQIDELKLSKQEETNNKEQIPETITIDGIERPTTNSEGKQIYPTEEGIRNFWKWFGDSKVVDDQGRPLVVYHGTDADVSEFNPLLSGSKSKTGAPEGSFFFADDNRNAASYTVKYQGEWTKEYHEGGNVMPVYLSLNNPLKVNANNENWNDILYKKEYMTINEIADIAKSKSKDSVIVTNVRDKGIGDAPGIGDTYIAFSPNQIKSAIGNNGEFDKSNNNILLSKEKPFNPNEDIPETKAQKAQRIGQDKFNRFKVIKEWLAKEKGINLSESADVYGAEERYYGKVANQQEDFREKVRNPLIEKISKAGYKLDDVEQYLLNRHAQEANAQNRKLTGKEDSTAYGISDADSKAYLDKAPKELAKLADEVQALTDKAQQLRLDNGIETQERVDAMKGAYKYYVPVRGDAESQQKQNQYKGTGKGFSMKYKPKRRLGHELRNEGVIENIFQDYERAIIQVEKNRIGKSLALMAAEIQMPELISIDQPVKRKVLRTDTAFTVEHDGKIRGVFNTMPEAQMFKRVLEGGLFEGKPSSNIKINKTQDQRLIYSASPMLADNEVLVYMNGHEIRLQINDELLARAYKNMGVEALGSILSTGRAINGWMSKAYTGYNPEFILTNIQRDFQSGIINLTGEQGLLVAGKAVVNYPSSFISLLKYAATGESDKWIDAYRDNGGNTGAAYLPDLERLGEEVKREYASYQGVIANLKEGDSANALRAAGRKAFNATLKYINHLNSAGENAFRLATFKAMVESGKSVNEAASMAKNVTVNFNRKGEMGAELNALYLFFNASLQGTAATSHALFKGRHKYQAWGLSGAMMAVGYMMASMLGGFDDEDKYDEISDATKSRNLIMSYGDGYVKIPVPYGYGFFYNAGRMFAEAQRKGELGKMPYQLMALAIEEFSPFNVATTEDSEFSSKKVFYGFLPTMLKIPAEITNNFSSFTNRELYPEKTWYKSEPDNEKMWRGTKGTVYDISAQYLASIGVEISPEVLKYMTRTATGGSGAFVDSAVSGAMLKSQGAELETREIPFARKFYGENTIQDARARYGKAKEEARIAFEKFNALKKKNDIESVRKFVDDKKELLALNSYANKLSDVIKNIRDQQDLIKLSDKYTTAEKRLNIKELENQEKKYYDMFIKQYKTVKH